MKKLNYLQQLNLSRSTNRFNILFESIMKDLNLEEFKYITSATKINDTSLSLILEEIEKPQYVICESSGEAILLEEAVFMPESYLISEGILDKVTEKIQQVIDWIKEGIQKVLSKSAEVIKTFCEKVKNNAVIAAIRKKLGLDEKLKSDNFKQFVKIKARR